MANIMQMMHVANSCPGYSSTMPNVQSNIGGENSKSCANCSHWENSRCQIDLFDDVLTSLDQT
ncbi:hypothetical protein KQI89_17125 [Clostridium sp. MSJ-4]|uniref:Uncharacterized protein n=1 Tax=Clostridium simiarum TaxID=2841506 RepID=A0ABS6F6M0_9CLOT|nr:hypothetical protein [Clostridium simiarum]MBU5593465.1 hypothetical protein [Clostridium simiarum]